MTSVLYDAPGPRAKRRNIVYTVGFLALLALGIWWVISVMSDKGQLDWSLWKPFTEAPAWTTYLLPGLANTLKAAALAMVIALPLGAIFGIARLSDHRWVRVPASVVVEFFRAIPVLLLMLFANQLYANSSGISSDVRPLYAVVTGLVLYNASVLAEIVRAGILSLPKGQTEAAKAIGLRKGQTMTSVLLPQSVTAMLPALVSQLVVIVKDTALGGAILAFTELLNARGTLAANYANVIPSFIVVAVIYIILNLILTTFASWLERRLRRAKKSTGAVLSADLAGAEEPVAEPGVKKDDGRGI
ncbi:amino acid ABC transporter permease [Streptomyces lunaelactis]|uniref:amino acid ABC transporter permease n=1 Tax=Streptomyces lunaelactis TaxID=1535768 RepID=UPI001584F573|nr:amino acid ABC transporter permease [Streptomyces lunaelactis]NUK08122.1 amino acid ABC transporter permease [Streptomyces lunaelactis]NUK56344.1 amino acid ABC transporter permease [Streptomyces lunaelactis]NUL08543.1 amino acid ABC transporter permease [Streptomyces lunaelactis]NUL21725.1 amino acid ABC transporter permease [Streptomyces lunaelactis]